MVDSPGDGTVHVGKVVGRATGPVSAVDAFGALGQVVNAAKECFLVHQEESTKRARLAAYETVEVARIKAGEAVLKDYFAQVFAERRHVFEELFDRLDRAMDAGDAAMVHETLLGVVAIAQSSPLANLGDLGEIRKALDDPDQVWEL